MSLLKAQFTPSPPNGIRYFDFNKSVGIGCSANDYYKLRIYCDTALDRQSTLGLINKLIINDTKYGIYNRVLNGESTQFGIYNETKGNYSSEKQLGIRNRVIGGTGINFGIDNFLDGDTSGSIQYGINSYMLGGGYINYGVKNYLLGNGTENYGVYNSLDGSSSQGTQKGMVNYITGGKGYNYGIHNYLKTKGDLRSICSYNVMEDEGSYNNSFGIRSDLITTSTNGGHKYGIYSYIMGNASSQADNYFGVYSTVNTSGKGQKMGIAGIVNSDGEGVNYGVYARVSSSNSYTKYGVYSHIHSTSDGNKYGIKSLVDINGVGTKYGVHSTAPGMTNWAGYFIGRGYFSEPVAIGTADPSPYMLAVKGSVGIDGLIRADALEVIDVTLPDYVFDKNYSLRSIEEVESYIKENHHLPEVPSAEEVKEKGLNVAEMNNVLLKKVEELTLYLIEQNKQLSELKNENEELRHMINKISSK